MTLLTFLAVVVFAAAWVTLPLVPALREFFRPTDVEPLSMVGRDNADISRFARNFRDYLEGHLRSLPPGATPDGMFRLPDGAELVRVGPTADLMPVRAVPAGSEHRIVQFDHPADLESATSFRLEVRARQEFSGAPEATYRALLGERSASLGPRSMVMRWVHAVGSLTVGDGSHLYGRTSSEQQIRLGRAVGFDRLGAPAVLTGPGAAPAPMPPVPERMLPFEPPEKRARLMGDVLRIEGDVTVPAGTLVTGNLVVGGRLRLGPAARVRGNVKAHGQVELATAAVVEGSLVSREAIEIGGQCWVGGPVISEAALQLGAGAHVGSPDRPSTVSGRTVTMADGSVVCGQIVASEGGQTLE